jgi:hypothetical protein
MMILRAEIELFCSSVRPIMENVILLYLFPVYTSKFSFLFWDLEGVIENSMLIMWCMKLVSGKRSIGGS